MNKDSEHQRKDFWCNVYLAYVGASNSTDENGAKKWADIALARFDERFTQPITKPLTSKLVEEILDERNK
jgi:uncharacterized protein YukJ